MEKPSRQVCREGVSGHTPRAALLRGKLPLPERPIALLALKTMEARQRAVDSDAKDSEARMTVDRKLYRLRNLVEL